MRKEDPPKARPFACSVNQCGIFNFFRDPEESCAHHEDLEGANHGDHPHAGQGLVRADGHHHRVQRQHDRFEGEDHRREDDEIHDVATGPSAPREHVSTQAGQDNVRDDRQRCDDHRVSNRAQDRSLLKQRAESCKRPRLREDRGTLTEDRLPRSFECCKERKQKRSHHENRDDDQRDVAQDKARTFELARCNVARLVLKLASLTPTREL